MRLFSVKKMTGIYKITNKINGKIYIGQSKNIQQRWLDHKHYADERRGNSIIHKAIRKYGIDNFSFDVEIECDASELNDLEKYYIELYNTIIPYGYNMTAGGDAFSSFGESNPNSKLTNEHVYQIRERYANGERKSIVYEDYKHLISINTFADIWIGKTWPQIHMDVYTKETKDSHKHMSTSPFHCSTLTDEDVLAIRDYKNHGNTKEYVYKTFFQHININTFSDVWNGKTFKHIISDVPVNAPTKEQLYHTRSGTNNPNASVSEEVVKEIRRRRDNGEKLRIVHRDYEDIKRHTFSNIWYDRSYKNIQ